MDAPSLYALLICGVLVVKFFLIGCIVRYRKEQKKEYQLQLRRKTLKPGDDEEEVASSNKGDPEIGDDADDWGLAGSRSSSSTRGSEVDTSSSKQDAQVHQEVNTNDDKQGAGLDVDEYLDQFEMNATSITEQQGEEEETVDGEVVRQKQQEDQRDVEIRLQSSWDEPNSVAAEGDEKLGNNGPASSTSSSDSKQETPRHPQETSSVTFQIDTDVATMPPEVEVVGNNNQDTADDEQDDDFITIPL